MLQNHSHVKIVQIKPAVLEYIMNGPVASESAATVCDPCDACNGQSDTHNKKLQKIMKKILKEKCLGCQEEDHIHHIHHIASSSGVIIVRKLVHSLKPTMWQNTRST
jgi:hypothetical protein